LLFHFLKLFLGFYHRKHTKASLKAGNKNGLQTGNDKITHGIVPK